MQKAARSIAGNKAKKAGQIPVSQVSQSSDTGDGDETTTSSDLYEHFWEGVEGSMILDNNNRCDPSTKSVVDHSLAALTSKWLFHPAAQWKVCWDVLIMVLVLFSILYVPFRIGFNMQDSGAFSILDLVFDAFFFLDIFITMNTALVDFKTDHLETNRWVIFKRYLKFWFWIDLASSIPLDSIASYLELKTSSAGAFRLIKILRLFRLLKLFRIFKLDHMKGRLEKFDVSPALINVVSLLMMLMLAAHVIACFWVFIARQDVLGKNWKNANSWITNSNLEDAGPFETYVCALYWTLATILSIGYGDIHAVNMGERVFSIFVMLTGGIMFGAIISQITRLTEAQNPMQKLVNASMTELEVFLSLKQLPKHLKQSIKVLPFRIYVDEIIRKRYVAIVYQKAYGYYFQRKSVLVETGGILDDLTHTLSNKLTRLLFEKEIARINLFTRVNYRFVNMLVTSSRPFAADTGTVVVDYGDVCDEIYFVISGLVRIETKSGKRNVIAGYVSEGGYFGDFEYLSKSLRIARYTAVTNCALLAVSDRVMDHACKINYEAGIDFRNELSNRYSVFRTVMKLPPITLSEAITRNASKQRGRVGRARSLKIMDMSAHSTKVSALDRYYNASQQALGEIIESGKANASQQPVRSKLWVDGELCTHEKVDVDNNRMLNKALQNGALYRYIHLDSDGTRVVREASLSYASSLGLLHPKGNFKGSWDFFIGVLIIYSIIAVPVQSAFHVDESHNLRSWELFVDASFLMDVFVNFRSLYFDEVEDAYIAIQRSITLKYVRSWFAVDVLSSIPFDLIIEAFVQQTLSSLKNVRLLKIIRLTRLLKLIRVLKLRRIVSTIEEMAGISVIFFDMGSMLMQVFLVGHLVACAWWGLSITMSENGWFDGSEVGGNLRVMDVEQQYVAALYQVVTTLTTTGYGDLYANNSSERIVMMFIMCMGASTFGYMVGSVASLVGTFNQAVALKTEKLTAISSFLSEKGCPGELSASIMRHFRHLYAEISPANEKLILERLPKSLQIQVIMYEHREKMQLIPIFAHIDNESIKAFIFQLLKQVFFDTDQYILREGDLATSVVFLVSGHARVYHQSEMRQWRVAEHRKRELQRKNKKLNKINNISLKRAEELAEESRKAQFMQARGQAISGESAVISALTAVSVDAEEVDGAISSKTPTDRHSQVTHTYDMELETPSHAPRLSDLGHAGVAGVMALADAFSYSSRALHVEVSESSSSHRPRHSSISININAATNNAELGLHRSDVHRTDMHQSQSHAHNSHSSLTGESHESSHRSDHSHHSHHSHHGHSVHLNDHTHVKHRINEGPELELVDMDSVKSPVAASVRSPHLEPLSELSHSSIGQPHSVHRNNSASSVAHEPPRSNTRPRSGDNEAELVGQTAVRKGKNRRGSVSRLLKGVKRVLKRQGSQNDLHTKPFHSMTEAELTANGRAYIADIGPGECIGAGALMKGCELKASVRSMEPCCAYLLQKNDIHDLVEKQPGIALVLQMALGKALNEGRVVGIQRRARKEHTHFLDNIKADFVGKLKAQDAQRSDGAMATSRSATTKGWRSSFMRKSFLQKSRVFVAPVDAEIDGKMTASDCVRNFNGADSSRQPRPAFTYEKILEHALGTADEELDHDTTPLHEATHEQLPEEHKVEADKLSNSSLDVLNLPHLVKQRSKDSDVGGHNLSATNSVSTLHPRIPFLNHRVPDREARVEMLVSHLFQASLPGSSNAVDDNNSLGKIVREARVRRVRSCSQLVDGDADTKSHHMGAQPVGVDLQARAHFHTHTNTHATIPYYLIKRRQSFPSVDNQQWKEVVGTDAFI